MYSLESVPGIVRGRSPQDCVYSAAVYATIMQKREHVKAKPQGDSLKTGTKPSREPLFWFCRLNSTAAMWCVESVPSVSEVLGVAAGYTILRRVIPYGGLCQVAHSPASTNPHRRGIPQYGEPVRGGSNACRGRPRVPRLEYLNHEPAPAPAVRSALRVGI